MAAITPAVSVNKLSGLGKWLVKVLVQDTIQGVESAFTDGVGTAAPSSDVAWRRLTWRFTRTTPANTTEDTALMTMNVVNMTSGNIDSSWTAGDYAAVDAAVTELWATLRPLIAVSHTLTEVQYHAASFDPDLPIGEPVPQFVTDPVTGKSKEVRRFSRSGPPLHVLPINQAGTAGGISLPYQVAASVTFRTAARKHWGRVYLPGLAATDIGAAHGRFGTAQITTAANAFAEFASDLGANDFFLKIAVTQQDSKYATALMAISEIVIDDVPDVIRRRRPKQPSVKQVGVATP